MTLITTDSQHYTDIASAIRSKAGVQDLFKPSQMAGAILSIPTGGGAVLGSKTIEANGTYYASADSLDGYSQVTVNVSGGGDELINGIIGKTLSVIECNAPSIGYYTFASYRSLTSVNFPSCVSVGNNAFQSCSQLVSAIFPLCETVSGYVFMYDESLSNIHFPECKSIGSAAFFSCINLTSADFSKCQHVGESAFYSCFKLEVASFPLCTGIGTNAFSTCSSLTTAYFPKCTYVGGSAFFACRLLSDVTLTSCSYIGGYAFAGCYKLSAISLPACSSSIGYNAFNGCSILETVDLTGVSSVPYTGGPNIFSNTPMASSTVLGRFGSIYVPSSLYDAFLSKWGWSDYSARIVSV